MLSDQGPPPLHCPTSFTFPFRGLLIFTKLMAEHQGETNSLYSWGQASSAFVSLSTFSVCCVINVLKHNVMPFNPLKIDVERVHEGHAIQPLLSCKGTLQPAMVKGPGQGCTGSEWQS